MQQLRVLAVIASPIIGKLKAGEMIRAVIDRTGDAQCLVRITADDTKRDQNIAVGDQLERNAQKTQLDSVECSGGDHVVLQPRKGNAAFHRQSKGRARPREFRGSRNCE